MYRLFGPCVLLALFVLPGCANRVDYASEEAALRTITPQWEAMAHRGDAAGIAALFAEDGTLHPWYREPVTGPAAVQAYLEESYRTGIDTTWTAELDRIRIASSGDLAVEEGTVRSIDTGIEYNRYITVFEKVGDTWKVAVDQSTPSDPNGGAPDWAIAYNDRWFELYNARDAEGLAAMYTPDAVIGTDRITGRAAIARYWRSTWESDDGRCSGRFRRFQSVGPVASGLGLETCVVDPGDGTGPEERYWSFLIVFEQQPDGTWLGTRDIGVRIGD